MDDVSLRSAQQIIPCTLCDGNAEFHCDTCGDDLCNTCRRGHLRSNASNLHQVISYSNKQTGRGSSEESLPHTNVLTINSKIETNVDLEEGITQATVHEVHREILPDDQSKKTVAESDFETPEVTDSDFCDDFTTHNAIQKSTTAISQGMGNTDNAKVGCGVSAQWPVEEQPTAKYNIDTPSQSRGSAQWVVNPQSSDCNDIPSLTWKKTVKMPILNSKAGCHITYVAPDKLWVSDMKGCLFLVDLRGNVLETIETRSGYGFHTVNQNGMLLYADAEGKHIIKTPFKQKKLGITISSVQCKPLLKTGEWSPLCIHSSRHNDDLLVGMVNGSRARVLRCDSSGSEQQAIEFDNKNIRLYEFPQYVTENFNFDVITSDRTEVVAVDYSGRRRWSYSGSGKTGSGFLPAGICCDMLLNIVVYDVFDNRVHLLDKDGKYLSRLLVLGNAWIPQGLCFDEEYHLYCGDRSKILVFKYEYLY